MKSVLYKIPDCIKDYYIYIYTHTHGVDFLSSKNTELREEPTLNFLKVLINLVSRSTVSEKRRKWRTYVRGRGWASRFTMVEEKFNFSFIKEKDVQSYPSSRTSSITKIKQKLLQEKRKIQQCVNFEVQALQNLNLVVHCSDGGSLLHLR